MLYKGPLFVLEKMHLLLLHHVSPHSCYDCQSWNTHHLLNIYYSTNVRLLYL